jgi:prophage regulatory protein
MKMAKIDRSKLPETGFVRLPQVLGVYPVCKSTWWQGIKDGRYPKPVKLAARVSAWRVEDIRALIEKKNNLKSREE